MARKMVVSSVVLFALVGATLIETNSADAGWRRRCCFRGNFHHCAVNVGHCGVMNTGYVTTAPASHHFCNYQGQGPMQGQFFDNSSAPQQPGAPLPDGSSAFRGEISAPAPRQDLAPAPARPDNNNNRTRTNAPAPRVDATIEADVRTND